MTPLQMAMVASTIANGGVLMQPYLGRDDPAAEREGAAAHEAEGGRARDEADDRSGAHGR